MHDYSQDAQDEDPRNHRTLVNEKLRKFLAHINPESVEDYSYFITECDRLEPVDKRWSIFRDWIYLNLEISGSGSGERAAQIVDAMKAEVPRQDGTVLQLSPIVGSPSSNQPKRQRFGFGWRKGGE